MSTSVHVRVQKWVLREHAAWDGLHEVRVVSYLTGKSTLGAAVVFLLSIIFPLMLQTVTNSATKMLLGLVLAAVRQSCPPVLSSSTVGLFSISHI